MKTNSKPPEASDSECPWISVMDDMPPVNTWVETKGAEKELSYN